MLVLKILGALVALVFGVWLGMASGAGPSIDEVEERLGKNHPRQHAKRHFTFLNLLQRKKERGSRRRRRSPPRRHFDLATPGGKDRQSKDDPPDSGEERKVSLRRR